jgi:hypothetical protein
MGCNCGGKNQAAQQVSPRPPRPQEPRPVTGATMGPPSGRTQSFTLTLDSGRTQSFGSSLEARAALARAGGHGAIG